MGGEEPGTRFEIKNWKSKTKRQVKKQNFHKTD